MMEVLFTESAAGGMQYAKSMKHTIAEATTVFLTTADGSEPTAEELRQAQAEAEEQRRKWLETAIPMEGSPRDVVHLPLNLSMGDISDPLSDERAAFLQSTVLIDGPNFAHVGEDLIHAAREAVERIREADAIRIWTSDNPDEICGFYHLLTIIPQETEVYFVTLPRYEAFQDHVTAYTGWGEVDPGHFAAFLPRQQVLSPVERRHFSMVWQQLVRENGPLRAVVNGRLTTVSADFYDSFIRLELGREGETFHQARLIGNVLGRHQLGISDSLIALRMEEMISHGLLTPISAPPPDHPIYHRILKKN